ncbi:MAG: inositol monophosphatase [Deltaproteobacteria bacterium]|nr:inositol monophosphatase [Deltaproteobacteria bacterium]
MERFLEVAINAAKGAGIIQKKSLGKRLKIEHKGEIDLITDIDKKSEKYIIKMIKSNFPEHGLLTEESYKDSLEADYLWVIDPLDGTTNYAHGYHCFSISIALIIKGEIVVGVVYDPIRKELFSAIKGKGAYLNNKPIHVSSVSKVVDSLLCTGFPYDLHTSEINNLDHFLNMMMVAQAIRRDGSAALDLCYTACGRFDGFWELKLKPWDVMAGALIVLEAGGKVTDFAGEPFDKTGIEILATNGLVHHEMSRILLKGKRP